MYYIWYTTNKLIVNLVIIEDDPEIADKLDSIAMVPPINATADLTDEGSGDENDISINNVPASELKAPVELSFKKKRR